MVESFGEADIGPLYDVLDDNIIWKAPSADPNARMVFRGQYEGRANVVAHLAKIHTAFFYERAVAKVIVSAGEIVWALIDLAGSYAPQGPRNARIPFAVEAALRARVRKIVEMQVFLDTAALRAADSRPAPN